MLRALVALPLVGSLAAGCALMPVSGPESWDVWAGQHDKKSVPYALVRVTPKVTEVLAKARPRLTEFAEQRRPRNIRFGIGDIIGVTIFEASAGGLFIPAQAGVRPGNFVNIPNQAVDESGNISIPYAGAIRALGRTKAELQQAIVDALKDRAIEPQAIVTLTQQTTSMINVIRDGAAQRIPAQATPERILDTIARAGGIAGAGPDIWVMLERDGRRALAPFGSLINESANNVYVHAGDTIYIYREPQTFLAFGALGTHSQVPFTTWRVTLAEALGKAGGLSDFQADPAAVFLYRGETREVAMALGVDVSGFEGPIIPIIYNFNLRNPGGYFLATTFEMRNKDVLHASNSVSVEATKFLSYLATINTAINSPISTATNVYALKNLVQGTSGTTTAIITGGTTAIAP